MLEKLFVAADPPSPYFSSRASLTHGHVAGSGTVKDKKRKHVHKTLRKKITQINPISTKKNVPGSFYGMAKVSVMAGTSVTLVESNVRAQTDQLRYSYARKPV